MAKEQLGKFVRDALLAERSRDDIRAALGQAGWPEREIRDALAEFSEVAFTPPIPRPRPQVTARDTFIYLVLFTSLAFVATNLVQLVFAILDIWLPDAAANDYYDFWARARLRWAIATLIVAAPVYFWMSLFTHRRIAKDASQRHSPVRKWLTYLALFLAGLAFLGDVTYIIYQFLAGEATLRFVLKAATVGVVSLAVFVFYLRDVEFSKGDT